jgi:Tfp pilus assembly protein PilW
MPPVATNPTAPAAAGAVLRSEHGFTLIELLVAMVTAVVVLGGLLTFIITSLDQGNTIASRSAAVQQAQAGLNQLTQDLGEAIGSDAVTLSQESKGITAPGTTEECTTTTCTVLSFDIPNAGSSDAAESVAWTCPYVPPASLPTANVGSCTRQVGGSSGAAIAEMTGIESVAFFSGSSSTTPLTSASDPAYLGIAVDAADISQRNPTGTVSVSGMTSPIVIQTGVDLRNFS